MHIQFQAFVSEILPRAQNTKGTNFSNVETKLSLEIFSDFNARFASSKMCSQRVPWEKQKVRRSTTNSISIYDVTATDCFL